MAKIRVQMISGRAFDIEMSTADAQQTIETVAAARRGGIGAATIVLPDQTLSLNPWDISFVSASSR